MQQDQSRYPCHINRKKPKNNHCLAPVTVEQKTYVHASWRGRPGSFGTARQLSQHASLGTRAKTPSHCDLPRRGARAPLRGAGLTPRERRDPRVKDGPRGHPARTAMEGGGDSAAPASCALCGNTRVVEHTRAPASCIGSVHVSLSSSSLRSPDHTTAIPVPLPSLRPPQETA